MGVPQLNAPPAVAAMNTATKRSDARLGTRATLLFGGLLDLWCLVRVSIASSRHPRHALALVD